MFDSARARRLGVIVLAMVAATLFEVDPAFLGPLHAHPTHPHQGIHAHAPMPYEFTIQAGKADPSGQAESGGRAVAHRAGGIEVTSPLAKRQAPDARVYRTGFGTWEPTMGITKKGTVLINGSGSGGGPAIIASKDEGASWETVFDGHQETADPYMFVDPDTSRIFANDFIPPCHLLSTSDDEGKTWTQSPPAGCMFNEDHQTFFAGPAPEGGDQPQGYKNVVYLCSIGLGISAGSAGSVCSKSLDGGTTFVPTGEPAFTDDPRHPGDYGVPGVCTGLNAHGFVGPDGTVYLPRGWCGQPWLAISHDEGLTWQRVQISDLGMPCCADVSGLPGGIYSHESAVVADRKGNVYYSWVAADRLPYLSISRDRGETWGKPMMIGPPGLREALLPGMTIGADGKIAVFYMGSANSPWDPKTGEADGDYANERWNAYIMTTANALTEEPLFYTATLNDPAHPMWIGPCGPDPIRCGWGDFLDIVVSPKGEPWAVAVDLCQGTDCSTSGEAVVGRLVGGPSLR